MKKCVSSRVPYAQSWEYLYKSGLKIKLADHCEAAAENIRGVSQNDLIRFVLDQIAFPRPLAGSQ